MNNYYQSETLISDAPLWLINVCKKPVIKNADEDAQKSSKLFGVGRRNTDMTSLAGMLRNKGAGKGEIISILSSVNKELLSPLDETEILKIGESVARYDVTPDSFTHDSFAKHLVKEFDGCVLYCAGRGFYCFDGQRWSIDSEGLVVLAIARDLADDICADIEKMRTRLSEQDFLSLRKAGAKLRSHEFLSKSIKLSKSDASIKVSSADFDRNKNLINLQNGTYDLSIGKLKPFDPMDRLCHLLDFSYDPKATCLNFDRVMSDALDHDQNFFLRRVMGYSLLGSGREQKFFILQGKGKNGKSTIIKALSDVLGPLMVNIQPESLNGKMEGQIRNDLARLVGKRIMLTSETRAGSILDAPMIKQITGLDTLTVRFLHQEFFEFKPTCVPMIVTNFLPVIDGSDHAMKRRVCLIKFCNEILKEDPNLEEQLFSERPGIFNALLVGLKDYLDGGLKTPDFVLENTRSFIERSNLIKGFLLDNLKTDPKAVVRAKDLYCRYQRWSWENGYRPMSMNQFKEAFERETGLEQQRDKDGRFWPSLQLLN